MANHRKRLADEAWNFLRDKWHKNFKRHSSSQMSWNTHSLNKDGRWHAGKSVALFGSCFALSCNFSTGNLGHYSSSHKPKHDEVGSFPMSDFFQVAATKEDDPTWKLIHWYARFANLCGSKRKERESEVRELFDEEARSNRSDANQTFIQDTRDVDVSVVRASETQGLAVVSVAQGRDRAVIAVRGSVCATNFVQACKVWPRKEPLIQDVSFHTGFAEVADELMVEILPKLNKDMRISLTGHSLGGAVSTILGMRLKTMGYNVNEIVIFGSPKYVWGDSDMFVNSSLSVLRIEHHLDPVCSFPSHPVISLSGHARAYFSELSEIARAGLIHKGSFISDNLASADQNLSCGGHLIFGPIEQHCEWVSADPILGFEIPQSQSSLAFVGYQVIIFSCLHNMVVTCCFKHVGQKLVIGKQSQGIPCLLLITSN